MATATRFNRQSHETIIDQPAARLAYAFENVGSIHINNQERPFLSSPDGMTYTVFFDDNPTIPCCYSGIAVMEFFRDEDIQVVFAGYWYKNGLIDRYDDKGNDTNTYRNFKKHLARTDKLLMKMFEEAQSAKAAAEPKVVEVGIPTVDYRAIFRTFAYTAVGVYILSFITQFVLISAVR